MVNQKMVKAALAAFMDGQDAVPSNKCISLYNRMEAALKAAHDVSGNACHESDHKVVDEFTAARVTKAVADGKYSVYFDIEDC